MNDLLNETLLGSLKRRLAAHFYGSFILSWIVVHWRGLYGLCFISVSEDPQAFLNFPYSISYWDAQLYGWGQNFWLPLLVASLMPPLVHFAEGGVGFLIDMSGQLWLWLRGKPPFNEAVVGRHAYLAIVKQNEALRQAAGNSDERHHADANKISELQRDLNNARLGATNVQTENEGLTKQLADLKYIKEVTSKRRSDSEKAASLVAQTREHFEAMFRDLPAPGIAASAEQIFNARMLGDNIAESLHELERVIKTQQ